MITFVFGAGASFDSDPARRPGRRIASGEEHRPPLAAGLFAPSSRLGKDALDNNERAISLVMDLAEAAALGQDIEEVLEGIAGQDDYPATQSDLMAVRAYLAEITSTLPGAWLHECQGRTNYVRALKKAHRWNCATHGNGRSPIGCVTFNYDLMLEDAVAKVFGHRISSLDDHLTSSEVQVLKPHGSVTWRLSASLANPENYYMSGRRGLDYAIAHAADLNFDDPDYPDSWGYAGPDDATAKEYQRFPDTDRFWIPAISIPVRRKATFNMPPTHSDTLIQTLQKTTMLIAIGWRAREEHFLQLIQDHMPSAGSRVVAVAENDGAAHDTVDQLHQTGRFTSYAISGIGFTGFVGETNPDDSPRPTGDRRAHAALTLDRLLTPGQPWGIWTNIRAGNGLRTGTQ